MSGSSKGRICSKCQAANGDSDVYCFNCGTNLEDEKTLSFEGEPEPAPAPRDFLDFPPGARFADRYQIVEEIGYGSMGRVFKARDLKLDQVVALKMIRPEDAASPVILNLYKKETQLARSLAQENIIRVYDLGESRGVTFISMEFVSGQNLEQLLRASGPLAEETAVSITRQVCRALAAAHRHGIVHRDLKPQNILIDADGRVRVADFGLARTMETPTGSSVGHVVGTPAYMSPEQSEGREVDARTDMYSLGVIMYEMVTGHKPFVSRTIAGYIEKHLREKPVPPRTWNPRVSARMEALILGCLEKDPALRPTCAGGILKDIEERRPAEAKRGSRRLLTVGLPAAAAVVLAAVLFLFVFRKPSAPLPPPGGRPAVAVMYFENNTGDPNLEPLRKGLCYQIIQSLLPSPGLRVITPDRLFNVLQDRNLLKNATYSTDDLKQVAERTQARYILQGSLVKIGGVFKINSLLLDASTWESVGSTQNEVVDLNRLNDAVERITPEITAALHMSGGRIAGELPTDLDKNSTKSPEALKYYVEADTFFLEGKFAESESSLQKAIALDPDFARANYSLGIVESYLGDMAKAKEHMEKALRLAVSGRASRRDQYIFRAMYESTFGTSSRKAIEQYRQLLSLYPDDEEGLGQLASLYRNTEAWDAARDCFERLLLLNRFDPQIYSNLSNIAMAQGLYEKAAGILSVEPIYLSETLRFRWLGLVRLVQGRFDEALVEIEKAMAQKPEETRSVFMRGIIRQLTGDTDAARADYLRTSDDPDFYWKFYGRQFQTALCLQEGRFKDFLALAEEGIRFGREAESRDVELDFRLMEVRGREAAGETAAAEDDALTACRIAGELNNLEYQVESLGTLGRIQAALGKTGEAEKTADRLKKLLESADGGYLLRTVHRLKADIAREKGDFAAAADSIRTAMAGLPFQHTLLDSHAVYYEARARIAEAAGKTSEAIQAYREITALTTGRILHGDIYARSFYRLGKLYLRNNHRAEAADAFENFLRLWAAADPGRREVADARTELAALKIR